MNQAAEPLIILIKKNQTRQLTVPQKTTKNTTTKTTQPTTSCWQYEQTTTSSTATPYNPLRRGKGASTTRSQNAHPFELINDLRRSDGIDSFKQSITSWIASLLSFPSFPLMLKCFNRLRFARWAHQRSEDMLQDLHWHLAVMAGGEEGCIGGHAICPSPSKLW